jgi:hypothetical protein
VLVPFVLASPPLLPTSWALRGAGNSTSPPTTVAHVTSTY